MTHAQQHEQQTQPAQTAAQASAFDDLGAAAAGQSAELLSARPMLRYGSRGEAVNEAQRKLNLHGADLVEDGAFGPGTSAAVHRFQRDRGLMVDGIIGPQTWGALDEGLQAQTPGEGLTPAHQATPGLVGSGSAALDDASLTGKLLMADVSEFSGFVSAGVLSPILANHLALLRDLGGDTQYSYEIAKEGLADGTLLGVVFNRERDALLNSKLAPTDPDQADFRTVSATSTGAVFANNRRNTRGIVLVGDGHSLSTRALLLDLSHELVHYRNEAVSDAIEADASQDLADAPAGFTPAQVAETRRTFVDEVCARHTEWWAAWTIRTEREGGRVSDVDPPAPADLFTACIDLALNFMGDPIYDRHGYLDALVARTDDSLERQVGQWLTFAPRQVLSGNPYRDLQSKAAFTAASALRTATGTADGLGGDIDP